MAKSYGKQTIRGRSGLAGRDTGARAHTRPNVGGGTGRQQQVAPRYARTATPALKAGQLVRNTSKRV